MTLTRKKPHRSKQKKRPTRVFAKGRSARYEILDNGGIPYVVTVMPSAVHVHRKGKILLRLPYTRVLVGNRPQVTDLPQTTPHPKGSSILVQQSPHDYVYIGSQIDKIHTTEPIVAYYSPVGNSSVPYPYAVGETYTYFMLDGVKVPNALLDPTKDGYGQFYGYTVSKKTHATIEKAMSPYERTLIHKTS